MLTTPNLHKLTTPPSPQPTTPPSHPSPLTMTAIIPPPPSSTPPPTPFSGPLRCIFFSEFDTVVGPALTCQSPPTFLTPDVFDLLSPFLITAPELTHKLITLTLTLPSTHTHLTVLSYPIALDHPKYPRNSLLFNLSFAFLGRSHPSHRPYHTVLRKLASYIEALEVEAAFLFQPHTKQRLPLLLQEVWEQLSTEGQCSVLANASNRILLRLHPQLPDPPPIHAWDVPVLTRPLDVQGVVGRTWDLTLRTVIPFIDSRATLARIAHTSTIPLPHVHRCIHQLVARQACTLVDPFQWTNAYAAAPALARLYQSAEMQRDGVEWVGGGGAGMRGVELVRLYGQMRWGEDVEGFVRRQGLEGRGWGGGKVDVRRLVVFGMMHGVIRRVRVFPIVERGGPGSAGAPLRPYDGGTGKAGEEREEEKMKEEKEEEEDEEEDEGDEGRDEQEEDGEEEEEEDGVMKGADAALLSRVLPLCDGRHCSDELCYRFAVSWRRLRGLLCTDPRVVFVHWCNSSCQGSAMWMSRCYDVAPRRCRHTDCAWRTEQ